jgi:hypothetical protein
MESAGILDALPARLQWMVFFRIAAIRTITDDETIRRMYFLPESFDLDEFSHVVLTSEGRGLAPRHGEALVPAGDPPLPQPRPGERSLGEQYKAALARLRLDRADCVGIGRREGKAPAFLHVEITDGNGLATALFEAPPSTQHYELLPAVGVEFLGGESQGDVFVARFRNRLSRHVLAGRLASFSRTQHCNDFFLNHGVIDAPLAEGLSQAAADRVRRSRSIAQGVVLALAERATRQPLPMICEPPPPATPFEYGDLVPLGLLLRALNAATAAAPDPFSAIRFRLVADDLRGELDRARQNALWAFHRGRLVTATDSALILLGLSDPEAVEALETFADGTGGYYPQLWSDDERPGHMRAEHANRHWRQTDVATTCLVAALRRDAGLPERTSTSWLAARFDQRAGLFFANPFLMDLCLAMAVSGRVDGAELRGRLLAEVQAAANPDGSFGAYDTALSTALAILTLATLGAQGRGLRLAQLRLLDLLEPDTDWPVSTPFYSTFALAADEAPPAPLPSQHLQIGNEVHELSLYRDRSLAVLASLATLALSVPVDVTRSDAPAVPARPAARYGCSAIAEYVTRFALAPYTGSAVRPSAE